MLSFKADKIIAKRSFPLSAYTKHKANCPSCRPNVKLHYTMETDNSIKGNNDHSENMKIVKGFLSIPFVVYHVVCHLRQYATHEFRSHKHRQNTNSN